MNIDHLSLKCRKLTVSQIPVSLQTLNDAPLHALYQTVLSIYCFRRPKSLIVCDSLITWRCLRHLFALFAASLIRFKSGRGQSILFVISSRHVPNLYPTSWTLNIKLNRSLICNLFDTLYKYMMQCKIFICSTVNTGIIIKCFYLCVYKKKWHVPNQDNFVKAKPHVYFDN